VSCRARHELVVGSHGLFEGGFDRVETGSDRGFELGVGEVDRERGRAHPRR